MNYKMTEHYARNEEKLIAEFSELHDTKIFVVKKLADAEIENHKLIYRIYDDEQLVQEINKDNISVSSAHYAEGNRDIEDSVGFHFNVMLKTRDSAEKKSIANFSNKKDASLFIVSKCEVDATVEDNDLFFIYKDHELIDTLSKIICEHRNKESTDSQGNKQSEQFRPTPLPTRPTPQGGPSDCWVEEDKEEDL